MVFLIQPRKGFTTDLFLPSKCFRRKIIIKGPYGKDLHLESYGTVLLFATGIRIAG